MKAFYIVLLGLSTATLISCTKVKDSDRVGDAQFCLDTATAATVQNCVDKVSGIETSGAYIIRCSANFIQNGFGSSQQIVDTFKSLNDSGAGSTTAFLSALNFDGNTTQAESTFNNCTKTNQKGLSMLAAMVKSATFIASLDGLTSTNPADIANAINNLVNDPQAATIIGETVTTVYQSTCQTGSQVNETLCGQISDALAQAGTTNPADIGAALLDAWKNL